MTNVTRDKKIVWELSEPGPIPGCNVLVFEQEGGGRKLRCEIPPDGSFEKNWWEKVSGVRKPLISYAVQRSESLSHRFSRIFQAAAGQGSVTVHMVVLFRIADERRVIEELPRDPLRQLEERVAQLAERSIRRLEWREIEEDKLDLEQVILGSVVLGRFDSYGRNYYGSSGSLNGRWLDSRGSALQLYMGRVPLARLVDTNFDGRVDNVILAR